LRRDAQPRNTASKQCAIATSLQEALNALPVVFRIVQVSVLRHPDDDALIVVHSKPAITFPYGTVRGNQLTILRRLDRQAGLMVARA